MKGMVTGGDGFVGSHWSELLLTKGVEVCALVESLDTSVDLRSRPAGLTFVEGDVRNEDSVRRAVGQFRPDQIYHLAAISSVPRSLKEPLRTYETNLTGTLNVLEAARSVSPTPQLLYASTAQVYDASVGSGPLTEATPTRPETPYSASKLCAEVVARQYHTNWGLRVVIVRPFNCIGPRQAPDFVCSDFARQIAEISLGIRPPVLRVGDLSRKRDFTDVRDAVHAFVLAMDQGEPGEAYNVCSGVLHSIQEVVETLSEIADRKVTVETEADRKRTQDPIRLVGDWSKLNRRTGWRPRIPFRQSLADLLEYWMSRCAMERAHKG